MLFDYKLNLENLCITQFADLWQRTRRRVLTMKTKEGTNLPSHDSLGRGKEEEI